MDILRRARRFVGSWRFARLEPKRGALAAMVLIGGLATSMTAVIGLHRADVRAQAEALDVRTESIRTAVTTEVRRYINALLDVAAAVGAQQQLTAADFAAITAPISRDRLAGATGISFIVATPRGGVEEVQRQWRAQGSTTLRLVPVDAANTEHRFVVLTRSLDPKTTSLGIDVTGSSEATEALDAARDTRQVTASSTYVLLRDREVAAAERQLSFVLTVPVYAAGAAPDTGRFRGWLLMGMRGGDFLTQALQRVARQQATVTLIDRSTAGNDVPVAQWRPAASAREDTRRDVTVLVGQRRWTLSVRPTTALTERSQSQLTVAAGASGVVISVLLAGLVLLLTSSRDHAIKRVAVATAALHDDIAQRERVEVALRRRDAELTGFAGVVAHDLRSPLSVTAGYLALLVEETEGILDDTPRYYLHRVDGGLRRMARLIDDLLAYATAENFRMRKDPVDLDAVTAEIIVERLAHLDSEDQPTVEIGALPTVAGDAGMLRQVLDNLIGNAIKYTPHGRPAHIDISARRQPDASWQITVADRGIGIGDDEYDTVFDAFQRARGSEGYSGTGLGLAICRRIIERHGGTISAHPNLGGGTRFTITLPDVPIATTVAPPCRETTAGATAGSENRMF
jgi:signal transduction histidine kinase